MRKEILVTLCVVGLLVGWVSMASATTVTWKLLQDSSMTGKGPGLDGRLGTTDDTTTGQNNNCNMNNLANCMSTGSPSNGSYSHVALELPQLKSCTLGNDGAPCSTNGDCLGGICKDCPDVPGGGTGLTWDTISYMGNIGTALGNGTMTACQENGVFSWKAINIGSTESVASGLGATCINIRTPAAPATGCGVGSWNSTANIAFWVGCLPGGLGGRIDGLSLQGQVWDVTDAAPVGATSCGYTGGASGQVKSLLTMAASKGAAYLLVLCGNTAIPNDTTTTSLCLRGASVWDNLVAYTSSNVNSCTDPNPGCVAPGGCAGGVAEAAE